MCIRDSVLVYLPCFHSDKLRRVVSRFCFLLFLSFWGVTLANTISDIHHYGLNEIWRMFRLNRVLAENFGWVRLLVACFLYKTNPNAPKNTLAVGKGGPIATFNLIFLGSGWSWVGESVGFIIMVICFPTQHLVNRKHRMSRNIIRNHLD